MRFIIKHEIKGRLRIHILQGGMSFRQADMMEYYLCNCKCVTSVKVNERLQDAVVCYVGNREEMIETLRHFSYQKVDVPETFLQNSGRELNRTYWDKLVNKVVLRMGSKMFLPYPIRAGITMARSVKYYGLECLHWRRAG